MGEPSPSELGGFLCHSWYRPERDPVQLVFYQGCFPSDPGVAGTRPSSQRLSPVYPEDNVDKEWLDSMSTHPFSHKVVEAFVAPHKLELGVVQEAYHRS